VVARRADVGHHESVITVASHPPDLSSWDQEKDPYYLEVFGETEPVLDMTHAEVLPPGGSTAQTTAATPVYEYWWTIGHGGTKPEHRHLFEGRKKLDLWHRLEDIAARVYLYFPIAGGWRIQELAASAKYLAPVAHQSDWTEKAAADWQRMQPIVAGAGQVKRARREPRRPEIRLWRRDGPRARRPVGVGRRRPGCRRRLPIRGRSWRYSVPGTGSEGRR
jgi:hypothetical protein